MPRTAITLAKNHGGKWALVAGPDVPIQEQLQDFREIKGKQSHPEISELFLQESDGVARIHRMRSPKQQSAHDTLRAAELAAFKAEVKKQQAISAKEKDDAAQSRADADAREVEEISKRHLADPNRTGAKKAAPGKATEPEKPADNPPAKADDVAKPETK